MFLKEKNHFFLKAASCTLDASTKIYAYRVDCVHNDTLKMAGGLGRTGQETTEQEAGENVEGDPEDASKAKKKPTRVRVFFTLTWVDSKSFFSHDLVEKEQENY